MKRYRHALFFLHLAVEKLLKALITLAEGKMPPKIHNLRRLSELAKLEIPETHSRLMFKLNECQLAGRYPEHGARSVKARETEELFAETRRLPRWLKEKS